LKQLMASAQVSQERRPSVSHHDEMLQKLELELEEAHNHRDTMLKIQNRLHE
jgi:hypothetical protein